MKAGGNVEGKSEERGDDRKEVRTVKIIKKQTEMM